MKIDESYINHNALQLISELISELYEFTDADDNMERMRIATLGEIRGICCMADVMKKGIKT